ncbi:MAG: translation initiation factor IF-1 [Candidatus Paceibacterota bacterium]|jgi:translation initiation factor IF-1
MIDKKNNTSIGIVEEALPNTMFRVKLNDDRIILVYLSGKMRMNRIKVLIGDKVEMVLDDYGDKGRVVKRL